MIKQILLRAVYVLAGFFIGILYAVEYINRNI